MTTRRQFLKQTSLLLGAAPWMVSASSRGADGRSAPSDRIVMGSIGIGGQGNRDMQGCMGHRDTQFVALCDVDEGSKNYERGWELGLAPAKEKVERHYAAEKRAGTWKGVFTTTDFRELLARDDIDAITCSTPDHWHAGVVVAAAKAGKDIYCQKPLSLSIADGKAMVAAVHRYGRVFQCGSQRRASASCRRTCEIVRNGHVGKLHTVRVGLPGGHSNPGYTMGEAPMPVPQGFDYDRWLGPAPWAPYTHKRCHWTFRWNLDYSGGQLTDWGAHYIDMAHWGMGADLTGPIEVEGKGEFPPSANLWNTATGFHIEAQYRGGIRMIVSSSGGGVRFEGDRGSIQLGGQGSSPAITNAAIGQDDIRLYEASSIYGNFVECVKSRQPTAAPVAVAHRSISVAHLGNISMALGRNVKWDPDTETFPNDPEATALLSRAYREPWRV